MDLKAADQRKLDVHATVSKSVGEYELSSYSQRIHSQMGFIHFVSKCLASSIGLVSGLSLGGFYKHQLLAVAAFT